MKFFFDLCFGIILLLVFCVPMIIIAITVLISSEGPLIFWSDRVGYNGIIFRMPKFRSMYINTEIVSTDKFSNPNDCITFVGRFLRKYSLDELPQLFLVINGSMSLVGPRPALISQTELIALRQKKGLDKILPGLTGWAQVNGRDEISTIKKLALDLEYMNRKSFWFDIKILLMTIVKVVNNKNVLH